MRWPRIDIARARGPRIGRARCVGSVSAGSGEIAEPEAVSDERLARSERALDDLHRQGQDPAVVELLTDPALPLPRVLPDGEYRLKTTE